jgi:hypothetical protein
MHDKLIDGSDTKAKDIELLIPTLLLPKKSSLKVLAIGCFG